MANLSRRGAIAGHAGTVTFAQAPKASPLAKHVAQTIPHGESKLIPNVGHVPHIQVPGIFEAKLLTFLNS
jgi:pimeloyl-ACP methyl ester carboxylesterase